MTKYLVLCATAAMLVACGGVSCSEHEHNAKEPIYFEHNSVKVTPASQKTLDDGLVFLSGHRFKKIRLDGWADEQGGDTEYNMNLSKRRTETIRDYMVKNGVAENRITTKWHGIDMGNPYRKHRRVEVTVE